MNAAHYGCRKKKLLPAPVYVPVFRLVTSDEYFTVLDNVYSNSYPLKI